MNELAKYEKTKHKAQDAHDKARRTANANLTRTLTKTYTALEEAMSVARKARNKKWRKIDEEFNTAVAPQRKAYEKAKAKSDINYAQAMMNADLTYCKKILKMVKP